MQYFTSARQSTDGEQTKVIVEFPNEGGFIFETILQQSTETTATISFLSSRFPYSSVNSSSSGEFDIENVNTTRGSLIAGTSDDAINSYLAVLASLLVICTATGNILVCLAITWERRLQNVTNYFLMSLAITDLMVAILVMPLGILTLAKGFFPLHSEHCLVWICLDVLFCTASIMHLCTISIDRYLSLRYPMKFGRNKTKKRVTLKIAFVWVLSIAMSLPLSLKYSKDNSSVLVDGTCQIPDPVYKLVGSIVCFYIPLIVMLVTYMLTVQLLARQQQNLDGTATSSIWTPMWLTQPLERKNTWKSTLRNSLTSTPNHHAQSVASTDTELSTLDTHELWLPESSVPDPTPSTMTALHLFGAEMLKLSRGLESTAPNEATETAKQKILLAKETYPRLMEEKQRKRRASTWIKPSPTVTSPLLKQSKSLANMTESGELMEVAADFKHKSKIAQSRSAENDSLLRPCTCPYFGEHSGHPPAVKKTEVRIINTTSAAYLTAPTIIEQVSTFSSIESTGTVTNPTTITSSTLRVNEVNDSSLPPTPRRKLSYGKTMVTWDPTRRGSRRRGSSFGGARTSLLSTPLKPSLSTSPLRRSATLRYQSKQMNNNNNHSLDSSSAMSSSPCLLQKSTIRSHHSRNSSVIVKNSARHGRIIRLEQKATKVLGIVFFTFVVLWAPFFIINLLPTVCPDCEVHHSWFDLVTWLGYASSMVNPIFYTIFNKTFRESFRKILLCKCSVKDWRGPNR